jgi:hypothetical protein
MLYYGCKRISSLIPYSGREYMYVGLWSNKKTGCVLYERFANSLLKLGNIVESPACMTQTRERPTSVNEALQWSVRVKLNASFITTIVTIVIGRPRHSSIKRCICGLFSPIMLVFMSRNEPVGDWDHEVLGIGSFGEYKLYGKSTSMSSEVIA